MKESKDKQNAEQSLKVLQQERAKIEAQFKSDMEDLGSKVNPITEKIETVLVGASKTDVDVQLLALLWAAE
jgi:hypothetical protein